MWVASDLYHAVRLFYHLGGGMSMGRKERTDHGTQAAGYLGVEAVDIKAMIDFSPLFLYFFPLYSPTIVNVCRGKKNECV